MSRLEVVVVGCGAMGARHARVIAADPQSRLVGVTDIVPWRANQLARELGCEVVDSKVQVEAVVCATPATTHAELIRPLLNEGRFVLVEKPLVSSPQELIDLNRPTLCVGFSERFLQVWEGFSRIGIDQLSIRRLGIRTGRGEDVHVAYDLAVHEFERLEALFGPVSIVRVEQCGWHELTAVLDAGGYRVELDISRDASMRLRRWSWGQQALDLSSRKDEHPLMKQWCAFREFACGRAPATVGFAEAARGIFLAETFTRLTLQQGILSSSEVSCAAGG